MADEMNGIRKQLLQLIDKAYRHGYEAGKKDSKYYADIITSNMKTEYDHGYEKGRADGYNEQVEVSLKDQEMAYNKGMDVAWKKAQKLYEMSPETLTELFGYKTPEKVICYVPVKTVCEVIAKWEDGIDTSTAVDIVQLLDCLNCDKVAHHCVTCDKKQTDKSKDMEKYVSSEKATQQFKEQLESGFYGYEYTPIRFLDEVLDGFGNKKVVISVKNKDTHGNTIIDVLDLKTGVATDRVAAGFRKTGKHFDTLDQVIKALKENNITE